MSERALHRFSPLDQGELQGMESFLPHLQGARSQPAAPTAGSDPNLSRSHHTPALRTPSPALGQRMGRTQHWHRLFPWGGGVAETHPGHGSHLGLQRLWMYRNIFCPPDIPWHTPATTRNPKSKQM